jgi:hypothetical protein
MDAIPFTTPAGRLVLGSLYKPNDKDAKGNQLVYKTGADAGKARVDFFFAIAIPKTPGQSHWGQTEWGAKIWQAGHAFQPQAGNMPSFHWKVEDGDSRVPNENGKIPANREGYPGNWILKFSGGYAPQIYNLIGAADPSNAPALTTPNAINLGDFVQVFGNVVGNGATGMQAGVYLNHRGVALAGYGQRIISGPDVTAMGFGGAPLPAGASLTPPGGFVPPEVPGAPAILPAFAPPSLASPPTFAAPAPATAPTQPNYSFLGGIVGAGAQTQMPAAPPQMPTPPPAARVMLPAANGIPYEAYRAQGWTDAALVQHGMMAA